MIDDPAKPPSNPAPTAASDNPSEEGIQNSPVSESSPNTNPDPVPPADQQPSSPVEPIPDPAGASASSSGGRGDSPSVGAPSPSGGPQEVKGEQHIIPAESVMVDVPPEVQPETSSSNPAISTPTDEVSGSQDSVPDSLDELDDNAPSSLPTNRSKLTFIIAVSLIIVVILAGVGYVVTSRSDSSDTAVPEMPEPTQIPTPIPTSNPSTNLKKHTSQFHGVTFSYPSHYSVSGTLAKDLESWQAGQGITISDSSSQASPSAFIEAVWDGYGPQFYTGILDVSDDGGKLSFAVRPYTQELQDNPEDSISEFGAIYGSEIIEINGVPFAFRMSYATKSNDILESELLEILNSIQIQNQEISTPDPTSSAVIEE